MNEFGPSPSGHRPVDDRRGQRFRRNLVAMGAALGLTLGGLGIAAAQTGSGDGSTTTTTPAEGARPSDGPRHRPRPGLAAAATAIGISEEELHTALHDGQSIAQVAQSKGVDVQKVIDAMVADARTRIQAKVDSGDLTQAQADEKLADLQSRITDLVNRTGGRGRGHGPSASRSVGPLGPRPDEPAPSTTTPS